MCSLYSRDGRAICACFLGKGPDTVEDLVKLHSEALLWSGGGSGVISLADLEAELGGKRAWDPAGRPDREFIEECHRRGIRVFGVVFTAQGYEADIELNDEESGILSFGRITGKGNKGTWGLNEFYKDRHPGLNRSFREYFPPERLALIEKELEGADFLDLAACRDLRGNRSVCYWINSTGLSRDYQYTNYFMCKNSPVWMEHLKTIIEMQIDAGFDGVQFDEPALSVEVGGTRAGFCGHCRERFAAYMTERHGEEFRGFDYGEDLRQRGAGVISELAYFRGMPHWEDWKRWLLFEARRNLAELVDHARRYSKGRGGDVPIAANFFNWLPHHLALADLVDVFSLEYDPGIPPERTNLIYAETGRALDEKKPLTMVPHIAFSTHLRERAKEKKDVNILRYLIAEAAFGGGDFMVPYSCICITGGGAYYPPVDEISGYLAFIKGLRDIHSDAKGISQASVVLSFPSYFWSFDFLNMPGRHFASVEAITHFLQALGIQYRIAIWGDDEHLADSWPSEQEFLIVPQASHLTDSQVEKLREFIERGGRALITGRCAVRDGQNRKREAPPFRSLSPGENRLGRGAVFFSPEDLPVRNRAASRRGNDRKVGEWLAGMGLEAEFLAHNPKGLAPFVRAASREGGLVIHLLNPNYDYRSDLFAPVEGAGISFDSALTGGADVFRMHTPGAEPVDVKGSSKAGRTLLELPPFQIYAVLEEAE